MVYSGISLAQSDDSSMSIPNTHSQKLTLLRMDLNVPVSPLELEEVLPQSSVLVQLPMNQILSFYGNSLTTPTQATVLLQANPSSLTAAVLAGEIRVRQRTAEAGEAVKWPIGKETIQVVVFDAKSLLAIRHFNFSPQTRAHLEEVANSQNRLKFWGLLEDTTIMSPHTMNAQSSTSVKKRYLENPVVLMLIGQYPNIEELRQGVAETFVDALKTKDVQTLEWLISPRIFVDNAEELRSSEWILARQDFAFLMMLDHGETEFTGFQVEADHDASSWIVTTVTGQYRLWVEPFDQMIFVTGFEPMKEPVDEPR